ncbi:EF-hand, partial [Ramicandelaber brevisporus]
VTDKDRMQYLESFKMLDKDGDGSITSEELAGFLRSLGHVSEFEEKQLIEYVKSVDSNHNGMLEFDEFMELIVGGGSADNEEKELRETFKMFDKDGNGAIDAEEMVELMGYIGEDIDLDAAKELVQAFDSNKDGVISMDEWLSYML